MRIAKGWVAIKGEYPDPLEVEKVIVELVKGKGHSFCEIPGCHRILWLPGQKPDDPFLVVPQEARSLHDTGTICFPALKKPSGDISASLIVPGG
jgi:hypothetical protein